MALGAGTPYLYSFYAPQLLRKCQLPVSQLSTLPLSLNIGSALLGFLAGVVIDRNVKLSCFIGAVCTFFAYSVLGYCYVHESSNIWLLCLGLALVGFGSVSGFYAAVKCCTTNFPHHRGTAGAFPVAMYALSGMLFSYFCAKNYGEDIEKVFRFLAIVCSSMILIGSLTLATLVTPSKIGTSKKKKNRPTVSRASRSSNSSKHAQPVEIRNARQSAQQGLYMNEDRSTPSRGSSSSLASSFRSVMSGQRSASFLWSKELTGSLSFWGWGKVRDEEAADTLEPQPTMTLSHSRGPSYSSVGLPSHEQRRDSVPNKNRKDSFIREDAGIISGSNNAGKLPEESEEVFERMDSWRDSHVIQTITRPRFIAYFLVLATLQGIGQTYIYSVGFVVRTQIASTPQDQEVLNAEKVQSLQVSIISLLSFCGRLSAGPVSDLLIKKLKSQRLWNIVMAAALMAWACSQTLTSSSGYLTTMSSSTPANIRNISLCSAIFGFAFGILFGTFPSIIADSFGTAGFSTIWGLSTSGGLFTVKLFSAIFGADLSKNTEPNQHYCEKGVLCYRHTFHVLMMSSLMAMLITIGIITLTHHNNRKKRLLDNEAALPELTL